MACSADAWLSLVSEAVSSLSLLDMTFFGTTFTGFGGAAAAITSFCGSDFFLEASNLIRLNSSTQQSGQALMRIFHPRPKIFFFRSLT
jgi:hypothetical protein